MNIRVIFILMFFFIPDSVTAADIPTNVTLTAGETTITVDWDGDTDADKYYVYWGTSSGSLDYRVTVDDSSTEYTITGLDSDTTYYVAVSSLEGSDESDLSETESVATDQDSGTPKAPTGFFVTSSEDIGENSVILTWDEDVESDIDHYNVYYGTYSGSETNVGEASDTDYSSFVVSGLASSTRYYFSVSAENASGNESSKSEELIVDTLEDLIAPNEPAGISGSLSNTFTITVTIQDGNSNMADFSGNIVYYGNSAENLDNSADIGNTFSYSLTDLDVGATWYFAASSYDLSGNESDPTETIAVSVENTRRFLNPGEDFQGGCFIGESLRSGSDWRLFPFCLFVGLLLLFLKKPRVLVVALTTGIFLFGAGNSTAEELPEKTGNNLAGISVGYYIPAESGFEDFYGEELFPVYGFYERFFGEYFSLEVESGFLKNKGHLLTASGVATQFRSEITLVPVSSSLKFNFRMMPYIVGFIGAGGDYWYCKEQNVDKPEQWKVEEWVGGFHGKAGVRLYNTGEKYKGVGAIIEGAYSQIDRFGDNETDIGGWSIKFGFFNHF